MGQKLRPYSEDDKSRILEMRKQGVSFKQIAKELGRNSGSVYMKFYDMTNGKKQKPKPKQKPYPKPGKKKMLSPAMESPIELRAPEPIRTRPMFALVGERSEITATLRELFS